MPRPAKKKQTEQAPAPVETISSTTKPKFRSAIRNSTFDIFATDSSAQRTKDLMAKVGLGEGFSSSTQAARDYLPVPWLALQYLIGRPGIPVNTITEIIGAEGIGKSSLTYALMGEFVAHNIPCYYINSEPKALEPDWQLRLLGTDPAKAKKIRDIINVQPLHSLEEMDEHIRAWVDVKRIEEKIPMDVPIVVIIDSISKLMNPEEFAAAGLVKTKPGEKKKPVGVANISQKPAVTAKWLHSWCRHMPKYLMQNNVTIIAVSGQNQNMDAGAGPSYIKPSEKHNDTRVGGKALSQNAALRFTVTYKGAVQNSQKIACGKEVLLFCKKNSYGPSAREVKYIIYDDRAENYKLDVPDVYHQQAIDMDAAIADVLVAAKAFGLTLKAKRYSSTILNVYEVSAAELMSVITSNPEHFKTLTTVLSIKGYDSEESSELSGD